MVKSRNRRLRKKKLNIKSVLIILAIVSTIGILICLNNLLPKIKNNENKIDRSVYQSFKPVETWNAKYIWISEETQFTFNEWVFFRKKVDIVNEAEIENIVANIACDSKYWLYVNGKIVVREGNLKRGEKPNSTYYDQVLLDEFLHEGENQIGIMVWYYGRTGFSHIDSGAGMLRFQMDIGNRQIISDESWLAMRNPAFLEVDNSKKNWRLSESNLYIDANKEVKDWYTYSYDDSNWQNAFVHEDDLWKELIPTNMPQFVYSEELYEYENMDEYRNKIMEEDTLLKMKTSYNTQLIPYFKVEAKEGQEIIIANNEDYQDVDTADIITYITKNAVQQLESPTWLNGDYIYYYIPKGVRVISLGYRTTGYDSKQIGSFKSNNVLLNKLWEMSQRTLYVNMRDSYMDCPNRERAQWLGDASIEMEEAMYGLDTNSYYLYEKCIKTLIGWKDGNILHTVSPSYQSPLQLPIQNYIGIISMYDYYNYTGKKEFLENNYDSALGYLNIWKIGEDGLIEDTEEAKKDLWDWYDSSSEDPTATTEVCDEIPLKNAWYYYSLKTVCSMAKILDKQDDIITIESKLEKMKNAINTRYWDGTGYKSNNFEFYDARLNAVAILSGLADEDKYSSIYSVLIKESKYSTFMEKYVLEAFCKAGYIDESQSKMARDYSNMISNDEYTTLWEYWIAENGTTNHAWAGGPMIIMSKYYAGINPLKPGYEEISIKPQLGSLNEISTTVDTPKGLICLDINKDKEEINTKVTIPAKTLIAVEKLNNDSNITIKTDSYFSKQTVVKNGEYNENDYTTFSSKDNKYYYLYLNPGTYYIKTK